MIPPDFFFLRPAWLLLLIPAAVLVWLAFRNRRGRADAGWRGLVDAHLLAALAIPPREGGGRKWWKPAALGLGLAAAIVGMAGPTWEEIEQPAFQAKEPVVVVLSLAQSMNADDVQPSRLTRAGHKLRDILERTDGGDTGFVVYSDVPFVAAPLTSDGAVIAEMLPELSTDLMPTLGNRLDYALMEATGLLSRGGATNGRIVVLADTPGADPAASVAAAEAARQAGFTVQVIGIGDTSEAPLRTADGRLIIGQDEQPMRSSFDENGLRELTLAGDGTYTRLTPGPADVEQVLAGIDSRTALPGLADDEIRTDGWADMGFWLLLIPVALAPLAFRRNLMMSVPLLAGFVVLTAPGPAQAFEWNDLWQTPDQQAAMAFEAGEFTDAAQGFEDPNWRAAALYRAQAYANAADVLTGAADFDARFNRGNALAWAGDLEAALAAYNALLEERPEDDDVRFNRDLVARLLDEMNEQQEDQSQSEQQAGDQSQQDQQAGDEGQQGQQAEDQGQQEQQPGDQGQPDQQAGDQGQQEQQPGDQGQPDQQAGDQGQQEQQPGEEGQQDQQAGDQGQQEQQLGDQGQPEQQAGDQSQQEQQAADDGQPEQQPGDRGQPERQAVDPGQPEQEAGDQQGQAEQQTDDAPEDLQPEAEDYQPTDVAEADEPSAFERAMDAILGGNTTEEPVGEPTHETEAAVDAGITEEDQAIEQMLRRVPNDSSGLLRARIRQHYQQRR